MRDDLRSVRATHKDLPISTWFMADWRLELVGSRLLDAIFGAAVVF
jgi:hypothetical protein